MPPARFAAARRWLSRLGLAASFLLIVAALCRPQWGQVTLREETQGVDIIVVLDVSRSMLADDVAPTRLAAAKEAVAELLPKLQGDRIGLIAFAGSAFLVCPLTSDYGIFSAVLAEAGPDTLPLGGTALAGALIEAKRAFDDTATRGKLVILISDGEDHGGDLAAAADAVRSAGITVHAVAAGTPGGGLIPLPGGEFLKNRQGAIVKTRLQPEALAALAAATGGSRLDLTADRQALVKLHATVLSAAERSEASVTRQRLAERFQLPLALAVLLLAIEAFIGRRGAA